MRYQGKLTNWNDERGFGFVEPNGGGETSFVHIKSFRKTSRRPVEGDLITYKQVEGDRGKYKAVNVSLAGDKINKTKSPNMLGTAVLISFIAVLIGTTLLGLLPRVVFYFYIAMSVVTFIVYAQDKSAAQNDQWRTSEQNLHWLALAGGWPGAFFAQLVLRHKSSKKEFKQEYWVTVIFNIAIFAALLTQEGQRFLMSLIG